LEHVDVVDVMAVFNGRSNDFSSFNNQSHVSHFKC